MILGFGVLVFVRDRVISRLKFRNSIGVFNMYTKKLLAEELVGTAIFNTLHLKRTISNL